MEQGTGSLTPGNTVPGVPIQVQGFGSLRCVGLRFQSRECPLIFIEPSWSWKNGARVSECWDVSSKVCLRMPSSLIIDTLRARTGSDTQMVVICAYCRFDTPCSAECVLRGFVHQLLAQRPDLLALVEKHCKARRLQKTGPPYRDLVQMLRSLVASLDGTHIVVDGLDEIANDKEKVTLHQELQQLPARILIFSRPLELHFKYLPSATIFSIEARDRDIEVFVESSLRNHQTLQTAFAAADGDLVRDIALKIRERCRGM